MTAFLARLAAILTLLAFVALLQPVQPIRSQVTAPLDDWPMFLHDVGRTSFNSQEVRLSPDNAANLKLKWQFEASGVLVAQPIVVGDSVYAGDWDGFLYALDRETGQQKWRIDLGRTTGPSANCFPQTAGITSAPHVIDGVVYIGGGDQYKYAIDARTGTPLWRFEVGDNSSEGGSYNWDSPVVFNGKVYTGIASFCDRPFVQGKMWALDARTGTLSQEVKFVRDGELGGGIWTSPSIDPATGAVFVTTGSGDNVVDYAYCMVVCDPATLAVRDAWVLPNEERGGDIEWSTTATVFKHSDGRTLVGAAAKNGFYYAFDANRIGDGPIWQYRIAVSGECPLCGEGSIASSAYAYDTLYTAGGYTRVNGVEVGAAVRAHDPSTGAVLWERATAGPVFGSVVVANGLVAVAADMELIVLNARSGETLWSFDTHSRMFAAPTIAGGVLYAANTNRTLYAFWAGPYSEPQQTPTGGTPQPTKSSTPASNTPRSAPPLPGDSACFSETGKCMSGIFLDYWKRNGGLERFGFPITNELLMDGRVVQYTQRSRFEQHTENKPPFDVLLGRLGVKLTVGREAEEPFKRATAKTGQAFSPETGHNILGAILNFWQENGGVPVFGYPLSEAFTERSPTDGKNYTVQYFERQRLELHPENAGTRFEVLSGLLGVQKYKAKFGEEP